MNPVFSSGVKVVMDKERVLRWDMAAMRYLTEHYETVGEAVNLLAACSNVMTASKVAFDCLVHFYIAMLQTDLKDKQEEITFDKMLEILNTIDMSVLSQQVQEAIKEGSPEQ